MPERGDEILDRASVAELLGVSPETVSRYRSRTYRDSFPPPAGQIGGSPYWYRGAIEAWNASRTGRTGRPRKVSEK